MEYIDIVKIPFSLFIKELNAYLLSEKKVKLSDLKNLENFLSAKTKHKLSGRLTLSFTSEVKEKDGSITKYIEIHIFRKDGFLINSNRNGEYDYLDTLVKEEEKDNKRVPGYMKQSFDVIWKILKEHKGTIEVTSDAFKVEIKQV